MHNEYEVSLAQLGRLRALDCCAISDALDACGIDGLATGLAALGVPRRIAGRVVTVTLAPDDGRPTKRHLGTAAVDAAGADNVIVVAHQGRSDVAGWGGILSLGAATRGVQGVIVDGAIRDLDEARDIGFPVYAKAAVAKTARGRVIETEWGTPVTIAGIAVSPGDLVLADASGIAFIPRERVDEVLAKAELVARKEALMAENVRSGMALSDVMGTDYENMLKGGDAP